MIKLNNLIQWNVVSNLLIDVSWGVNPSSSATGTIRHYSLGDPNETILIKSNISNQCGTTPPLTAFFMPYLRLVPLPAVDINELHSSLISVLPNPTNGIITLDLGREFHNIALKARTITGQLAYNDVYENTDKINWDFKAMPGMYFL